MRQAKKKFSMPLTNGESHKKYKNFQLFVVCFEKSDRSDGKLHEMTLIMKFTWNVDESWGRRGSRFANIKKFHAPAPPLSTFIAFTENPRFLAWKINFNIKGRAGSKEEGEGEDY